MIPRNSISSCLVCLYVCHSLCAAQTAAQAEVVRRDFFVPSDPGIQIFVREVRPHHLKKEGVPIVLIHGARPSGAAWFDVDVPRGSLAADIAVSGHAVYVPDMRGFGRSTKPPEMNEPPEKNPPLVRSPQAVHDIQAVVEWVSKEHHIQRVAILGWATGGHWAGYFATLRPDLVSHLILCNTLYGASTAWPLQKTLQDPNDPTRLNRSEDVAYRLASAENLLARWNRSIPVDDKAAWRDPAVASAYVAAALASDSTSALRNPPSIRVPNGPLEDSFYLAQGRQFWDASLIYSPTLILRSQFDFWSRPEDVTRLKAHLLHAPVVRTIEILEGTHYVLLERAEKGRSQLLQEVLSFLEH
jgi:pimeloyl-ACP methyl ester carboxylesterase